MWHGAAETVCCRAGGSSSSVFCEQLKRTRPKSVASPQRRETHRILYDICRATSPDCWDNPENAPTNDWYYPKSTHGHTTVLSTSHIYRRRVYCVRTAFLRSHGRQGPFAARYLEILLRPLNVYRRVSQNIQSNPRHIGWSHNGRISPQTQG